MYTAALPWQPEDIPVLSWQVCCGRRQEEAGCRGAGLNGAEPRWLPAALLYFLVLSSFQIKLWSKQRRTHEHLHENNWRSTDEVQQLRISSWPLTSLSSSRELYFVLWMWFCSHRPDSMNLTLTIHWFLFMWSWWKMHRIMNINVHSVFNTDLHRCFGSKALWETWGR